MNQTTMDNQEFVALQNFVSAFGKYLETVQEWNGVLEAHRELNKVVSELGTQARTKL